MKKFIAIFLVLGQVMMAQNVVEQKFGKGLYNVVAKDSSFSLKFGLRAQSLFIGEWDYNETDGFGPGQSNFLIRRSRLKFNGHAFSPKVTYKIEIGLSNRDISGTSSYTRNSPRLVMDAVVKWNFFENFVLWVGQTKLPGNRERVISSANLQLVDRSMVNSLFNIDRDMGAQLRHKIKLGNFVIKEKVALSQGEGRNVTQGNLGGLQYTGRLELLPFGEFKSKGDYFGADLKREKKVKVAIGATYDHNSNAVRNRSNMGSYMVVNEGLANEELFETNINTLFLDAMVKYKGFSLMAEYALRDADKAIAYNADGTASGNFVRTGSGYNVQAGYLFKNNWEIAGRYTTIDIFNGDELTPRRVEDQYTLGVSKYFAGHKLKVQSDISYLSLDKTINGELMYRLQLEIHL